jgi:enoyl-CoA hydratase/3-hydroxyacyl-CoA dehydrogenase
MDFEDIETIAVLGAGNMGHGIAEVAALAGYEVRMRDIKEEFVQDGYDNIEWSLNKLAEKDRLTEDEAAATLDRITPLVDIGEAVGDADVVIEAVPEKMEIKKEVYSDIDTHAPEGAIFATNTSSLSITELSEVTDRAEQFCGMHFFNPPVRMQLVEVITGAHTSDATLDAIEALAEAFEKTPVRVRKDSPGFIVNRILVPLLNEACWLVHEDEATIAEVDATTKFDLGLPMGAFELSDQIGNDVGLHVLEYMHETLGDAYEPCPLLVDTVEAEKLGKKTGEGFYDYENGGVDIPRDAVTETVKHRVVAVMANEVGKLVADDVAPVEDIDEAVMLGGGFPDGPAKMADSIGLETLIETLESVDEATDSDRYAVSDGLRTAASDGGFYGGANEDDQQFDTINVAYPGESVGHIELDRPHRMNTISVEMLDELSDAIDHLSEDDDVRALLITGAGDRAFSAGADIQSAATNASTLDGVALSKRGQETFGKLETCPMPVVAGIDGYALGGGMELATAADMRVATERSELGQPEHNLGLIPGWGGTQRLSNIIGEGRAKEIIFTAERYDASELAEYGFINELTDGDLFDAAFDLAADLADGPPLAQDLTKRAMLAGRNDEDAGLTAESQAFGHLFATEDLMEGLDAFNEKRDPEFEGK